MGNIAPALIMGVPCELEVPFPSLAQEGSYLAQMPPSSLPYVFPTHLHNLLDDFCPGWTRGADGSPRQAGFCSQTSTTKLSFGAALLYRNNLLDGVASVLCCAIHDESVCQNEHSANILEARVIYGVVRSIAVKPFIN